MEQKAAVNAVVTWQVSINATKEEALAAAGAFLEKFEGKYLQVTFVRNVRYVAAAGA